MRVNPGESYQDIVDWDAEADDRIERAIAYWESDARERAEQYFCDDFAHSHSVLTELVEHQAVLDAACNAINSADEAALGAQLRRAVGYARIKWTNANWRKFAYYRFRESDWPTSDDQIDKYSRDFSREMWEGD